MSNQPTQNKPQDKSSDESVTEVANTPGTAAESAAAKAGAAKPAPAPKAGAAKPAPAPRRSEPRHPPPQFDLDDEPEPEPEAPKEEPILKVAPGRSIISSKRGILDSGALVFPSDLEQKPVSELNKDWHDPDLRAKALRLLRLGACVKL